MSTILNRKIAPAIRSISNIHWPQLEHLKLANGIPVTIIRNDDQPILQIELINSAGRILETRQLSSRTTASMLKEGAAGMTGQHLSERVDYYGGSLVTSASLDIARGQLFTLSHYQEETIPYLAAVWLEPDFPDSELLLLKQNRIQKLKEDLLRPDNVSYRAITEYIFGTDHPYGYNSSEQLYEQLSMEDIRQHYAEAYGHDNLKIIVTGHVTDTTLQLLERYFGSYHHAHQSKQYIEPNPTTVPHHHQLSLTDSYQTSIKVGRRLFHRRHPDYAGMFVVNVILGGYFGSRLMSSIREDLGYTYNIYSSLGTLLHDGFFNISTEVDHQYAKPTLTEIYRQINILHEVLIAKDELKMVRNYIMGHLLGMLDGPFNITGLVKSYMAHGLTSDDFDHLKATVQSITAEEIQDLARRYLQQDDLVVVVVG